MFIVNVWFGACNEAEISERFTSKAEALEFASAYDRPGESTSVTEVCDDLIACYFSYVNEKWYGNCIDAGDCPSLGLCSTHSPQ